MQYVILAALGGASMKFQTKVCQGVKGHCDGVKHFLIKGFKESLGGLSPLTPGKIYPWYISAQYVLVNIVQ